MSAKWTDLCGMDPNFTMGMESTRYLQHNRGECEPEMACALCEIERLRAVIVEVQRVRDRAIGKQSKLRAKLHAYRTPATTTEK